MAEVVAGADATSERDKEELLREAACLGDLDLVKRLVSEGVAVNSANDLNGWTGLHWACKRGRGAVVGYLLEAGADRDALTAKGERPHQLTGNADIRSLLGVEANGYCEAADGALTIVPNYLRSPVLGYVSDAGRRAEEEEARRASDRSASSSCSSSNNNNNDYDDNSTDRGNDAAVLAAAVPDSPARVPEAMPAAVSNGAPHAMVPPFHPVFFPTAYPLINQGDDDNDDDDDDDHITTPATRPDTIPHSAQLITAPAPRDALTHNLRAAPILGRGTPRPGTNGL